MRLFRMLLSLLALLTLVAGISTGTPEASAAGVGPVFQHEGAPVHARGVSAHLGPSTFEVLRGLAQVTCQSATAGGTIAGKTEQRTITGLRLAFEHCAARNNVTGRSCPVHSAKAQADDEILTGALRGNLVRVALKEAPTGVGLALAPKSAHAAFLSFKAPAGAGCVPLPGKGTSAVALSGGVIAEVGRVNSEASTLPLYLEVEKGPYGETSQAIQHALSAPQLVLSSFGGIESPISGTVTLSFQETVEVRNP